MSLIHLVRSDYRRYRVNSNIGWFGVIFLTQGFWATTQYRLARAALPVARIPILGIPARVMIVLSQRAVELLAGITIALDSDIGQGLHIAHYGGTMVGPARMGDNCNLSQGVIIGVGGRDSKRGRPTIGNRVHVGANAILVGNITIGDDAAIGAGAVVTNSVPPRGVAIGNPARVVSYDGSFDMIAYDGMQADPTRCPTPAPSEPCLVLRADTAAG